jgi:hypothetical protein
MSTKNLGFTPKLYKIRAHLLHYTSLLEEFRITVDFVSDTPNPAMDSSSHDEREREMSKELLKEECNNLLTEIRRLVRTMDMQDKRLKNVMDLVGPAPSFVLDVETHEWKWRWFL